MVDVRVQPLGEHDWREAIAIEIAPEQWAHLDSESLLHFLAEGIFHPTFRAHAIYAGDQLVGLVSFGYEHATPTEWWIPLIVIGHEHQHRGYGRAALRDVIEQVKARPDAQGLGLSYKPANTTAARLYTSLGFVPGTTDERGEIAARLTLR